MPKDEIDAKVAKAAATLNLTDYLDRKPRQLSGGQRQRVAIGRAIVRQPKAFLFDEPLSNLDAALRVNMRIEIMQLHQSLGATMIYVTHDQVEAMTMADRIVVLNKGNIEQVGSPLELYNKPDSLFVAGFIGSPKMNFIRARREAWGTTLGIRPEHIALSDDSPANGRARSCSPSIWAPIPSSMSTPASAARSRSARRGEFPQGQAATVWMTPETGPPPSLRLRREARSRQ